MKPRILLIGRNGQIGGELQRLLPRLGEVVAPDRREMDLSRPSEVRESIRKIRPALIVNAAAYTAVDQAESDEPTARSINADAPALMAEEAKKIGAAFVHFSTDYVFDGLKVSPYSESDSPNPLGVYGKTKLSGEQAIRDTGVQHLIFRTAWVYATRGRNFLLTVLRLASQREELRIVQDQIGAPTWSREIARATTDILARLAVNGDTPLSFPGVSGTYHMTAQGSATWYDFAQAILDEAARAPLNLSWMETATGNRPLIARRVVPITTAEYPTPARRPPYSVLSNSLLARTFGLQLSEWRVALHDAFRE
jgi:dTDP-4-dehydrorhamnose reductase